uniref:PCI domain-containing protein n=1 Tax=Trichuris muris TaxID=70415 RepID=A0A5S6QCZ1_TRIMR
MDTSGEENSAEGEAPKKSKPSARTTMTTAAATTMTRKPTDSEKTEDTCAKQTGTIPPGSRKAGTPSSGAESEKPEERSARESGGCILGAVKHTSLAKTLENPLTEPKHGMQSENGKTAPTSGSKLESVQIPHGKADCPQAVKDVAKTKLMEIVTSNQMGPYYASVCKELNWPIDKELLIKLKQANRKRLRELDEKFISVKKTKAGRESLKSVILEKAKYLCSIGKLTESLDMYDLSVYLTVGVCKIMDIKMEQLRLCMLLMNKSLINAKLEEVRQIDRMYVDWERRRRLKAYEGYYAMLTRDYEKASAMLLDLTCTFRSYELMTLDNMILYAVIASSTVMDRQSIKKRILDATDMAPFLHKNPLLRQYVETLYNCDYAGFFRKLVDMESVMKMDYVLAPNYKHIVRIMRLKAYDQFLAPYSAVHLQYMADKFCITVKTLTKELERFIRHQLLGARIDEIAVYAKKYYGPANVLPRESALDEIDQVINRVWRL